jgi:diguanylate cyclase (GGDEF)-like protein/PAS domain S-box-containing protein
VLGLDGCILQINPAACALTGYPVDELIGVSSLSLVHPDDRHVAAPYLKQLLAGEIRTFQMEERFQHKDGSWIWCLVHIAAVCDDAGRPLYTVAQMQDVTERKQLDTQLQHQALHDALTGLPNRSLLLDRLEQGVERARRHHDALALLFLDLDNFKVINDSMGHAVGDELLVLVAKRLGNLVRASDTIARFGGDEFVMLLSDPVHLTSAIETAQRIAAAMAEPFRLQQRDVTVSVSIGIALSTDQSNRHDLLRQADIALYRAKAQGKGTYDVFDETMHAAARHRLDMESDLRRALARGEFVLHFQPKVDLATGAVVGAEALVRWQHPERGLLSPAEFIPVAEETGLILPLGAWILRTACAQGASWACHFAQQEQRRFTMSVNLSGRQFVHPRLVEDVAAVLDETRLPAACLALEITESVTMGHADTTIERLRRLKAIGVTLSVDDFGTGYSSLAYLKRFPVDVLKIDRSFVSELGDDVADTAIVSSIITLAHALHMRAVEEGVETTQQYTQLRDHGCDRAQGYYIAKPLPAEEFTARYLSVAAAEPYWLLPLEPTPSVA